MKIKINKNSVLVPIIATAIAMIFVIAVTTGTFAKESEKKDKLQIYTKDATYVETELSKEFEKSSSELKNMKAELKTWDKVYKKLLDQKKIGKAFSKESKKKMYREGKSLEDMGNAELIAAICGLTAEEVLLQKGNTQNYTITVETTKEGENINHVVDNREKLWSEVMDKLKIDALYSAAKLGMTYEDITQMEKEKLSQYVIFEIAYFAADQDMSYQVLWKRIQAGQTLEDAKNLLSREHKEKTAVSVPKETSEQDVVRQLLVKSFDITEAEIALSSTYGITDIKEIANAKQIAAEANVTLSKVFEKKNKKNSWADVKIQLKEGK